ncbi:MAG: dihydroorotase [Acidobacteriota bacterium]
MKRRLLLRGGRVVDPSQGIDAGRDLLIEDGKVVRLGKDLPAAGAEVVEVDGLVVVPGVIDGRVSRGEPGFEHRETLVSGLAAAAAGGYAAVVAVGDTDPPVDHRAVVESLMRSAEALGGPRLYPMATITKGLAGTELAEIGELSEAGAVAVSDAGRPIRNAALLRRALLYARHFDLPVLHRACDPDLDDRGVMHEGAWSTRLGLPGRPAISEEATVARDLLLVSETGGRYHLSPVTLAGSLERVRQARARGLAVTCDVTPHHLLLTDEEVAASGFSTATRLDPPLRPRADVDALLAGLADGTIDAIVSDHRPYHADEKEDVQFSIAPPGAVGLETTVSLCLDRLVHAGVVDLPRCIELLSTAPARLFGLPGGNLRPGSPADVTLLDLDREVTIDPSTFRSLGRSTPFAGQTLRGAAVGVFVGGRRVELD